MPMSKEVSLRPSRYESQKRRDWQTFMGYLGAHVLEFLRYLDRFGKTRVHAPPCPAYGLRDWAPPAPCRCPVRQAWGSLDERHGSGSGAGANPFAARAVRLYLRDVRDTQARARGISYHSSKKKRKAGGSNSSGAKNGDEAAVATTNASAVPPLPPCLSGVPLEYCCDYGTMAVGGGDDIGGFYLPLQLSNTLN